MDMDVVISGVQKSLGVVVDGKAGPETWSAIYQAVVGKSVPKTAAFRGTADARSETTIATLQPQLAPYARALLRRTAEAGFDIRIIGGTRSYAQQDALFAQGRSLPGRRVTHAKGGESNHNFGIAFDIGVFEGKACLEDSSGYDVAGAIGISLGLEWGGHWTTITDKPHFQLRPLWAAKLSEQEMLVELRHRVKTGVGIYP